MIQVVLPIVGWWLALSALGWAAVPLAQRLLGGLPDRGLGFSRPLGLLLAGYVFWLGGMTGLLPNTTAGAWSVALAIGAAGAWLGWRDREVLATLWREKRALLLGYEALFATAFVLWSLYRAYNPNIETAGGEKYMEMMFVNGILASPRFPPNDAWMAGHSISYYYFGYVMSALMIRLTGLLPWMGFTLVVPATLAMTLSGAFSLGYNLVGLAGDATRRWRLAAGGLTGLLLAGVGSLHGFLEMAFLQGWGSPAMWDWLDIKNLTVGPGSCNEPGQGYASGAWLPSRFIWWWRGSRVIQDQCREVIHEFPFFSFMLADVHPHLLDLPFTLLVLALSLAVLTGRFALGDDARPLWSPTWLALPWAVGALGFLNAWDLPTFAFVLVVAYGLATLRRPAWSAELATGDRILGLATAVAVLLVFWRFVPVGFAAILGRLTGGPVEPATLPTQLLALALGAAAVYLAYLAWERARQGDEAVRRLADTVRFAAWLLLLAIVFYLPFHLGFRSQVEGIGVVDIRTRLPQWLVHFGLLAFLALSLVVVYMPLARRFRPGLMGWLVLAMAVPVVVVAVAGQAWTMLLLALGVAVAAVVGLAVWQSGSGSGEDGAAESGLSAPASAAAAFALLCVMVGLLLPLGTEFLFVRDLFGTRMNTVFKLYFQAWTLLAVAGGFTFYAVARRLPRPAAVLWGVPAALLVAASLVYPAAAIRSRTSQFTRPTYAGVTALTLDGLAWWQDQYPDDLAAAMWLRANATGTPVIVEAPGGGYSHHGRMAMATGFPTVMGWDGHEHQWRGERTDIDPQKADAVAIYTTNDPNELLRLLAKYDARYLIVGDWERAQPDLELTEADDRRFGTVLKEVFSSGGTVIYERP